jgi:hypothetical protein
MQEGEACDLEAGEAHTHRYSELDEQYNSLVSLNIEDFLFAS